MITKDKPDNDDVVSSIHSAIIVEDIVTLSMKMGLSHHDYRRPAQRFSIDASNDVEWSAYCCLNIHVCDITRY